MPTQKTPQLVEAPFPFETSIAMNGVLLSQHQDGITIHTQTLNLSAAELTTELTFTAGGTNASISVLQFLPRSTPSLAIQRITIITGIAVTLQVNASIETKGINGVPNLATHPNETLKRLQAGAIGWNQSLGLISDIGASLGMAVSTRERVSVSSHDGSKTVVVDTYASVVSGQYHPRPELKAIGMANAGVYRGFDQLRTEHRALWAEIWRARVVASGAGVTAADQQALDFGLFFLRSSAHPAMTMGGG
jgi:trehalose/maltose hydrolase-like predicted phosphorylase